MAQRSYANQSDLQGAPGMPADSTAVRGRTMSASGFIEFGEALQRKGDAMCETLKAGGKFIGIAIAPGGRTYGNLGEQIFGQPGGYDPYDNVAIGEEGPWYHVSDNAFAAGAGLAWNLTAKRWTSLPANGTNILATPGVESMTASAGGGALIKIKLRRQI